MKAFHEAMEEGSTPVVRLPIMIIGQARSGKTSLKKSLKGQLFSSNEKSTDGIVLDPSYFSVTTEMWNTGEKEQGPGSDPVDLYYDRLTRKVVENLENVKGDIAEQRPFAQGAGNTISSNTAAVRGSKSQDDDGHGYDDVQPQTENPADHGTEAAWNQEYSKIEEHVSKLSSKSESTKDDQVYSILWDFGGQSVYYDTHPIFLTTTAIYVLVHDLREELWKIATRMSKEGVHEIKEDRQCTKTNEDYLHFWLSSVSCLPGSFPPKKESNLPKRLPPVFLVCTHADKYTEDNAKARARKIHGSLKSFGEHLCRAFFAVDNTKSGSGIECSEVKRLRTEIRKVAEELLQMREPIPIKWLTFEEKLKQEKKGNPYIDLEEAKTIARDKCRINDDQQFFTMLNFLHDQRILIHFDDPPELKDLVILDPHWLIDLFRKVITVKPHTGDMDYREECWSKLETEGILDDELLRNVWKPILTKETAQNDVSHDSNMIEKLIAVMERFSLVCSLPPVDDQKQYLVPSMLNSHSDKETKKLLSEASILSLFVRFKRLRPDDAGYEHLQVPIGVFSRLVVKFLQWGIKNKIHPLYYHMYKSLARFPTLAKGYSVILLGRSSCIEVVVCKDKNTANKATIGYEVRQNLEVMLRSLQEDWFWLNSIEYEFCVICPLCCEGRSRKDCKKHCEEEKNCEKEECLHFWPESALQNEPRCLNWSYSPNEIVPVEQFLDWFEWIKVNLLLSNRQSCNCYYVKNLLPIIFVRIMKPLPYEKLSYLLTLW